jgi:glutathione S-transferase
MYFHFGTLMYFRSGVDTEDSLKWLDEELANRRYIAGDKFTVADITAMIAVDFGRVSKIAIKPEQKNLARWHAEVAARPSAKA